VHSRRQSRFGTRPLSFAVRRHVGLRLQFEERFDQIAAPAVTHLEPLFLEVRDSFASAILEAGSTPNALVLLFENPAFLAGRNDASR
jgi:hypothetical protein